MVIFGLRSVSTDRLSAKNNISDKKLANIKFKFLNPNYILSHLGVQIYFGLATLFFVFEYVFCKMKYLLLKFQISIQ